MFRPPSSSSNRNESDALTPDPNSRATLVKVGVDNFRVLGFDEDTREFSYSPAMSSRSIMNDSRLEYEALVGIRYINAQDFGNSVWSPSLTFPTAPVTNVRRSF
jgi:hypothetical protein